MSYLRLYMDGTPDIEDDVHNLKATVLGTPAFATLLGAQAPVITPGTTNLLSAVNSDLETGVGDWLPWGGNGVESTISSSTDWYNTGTHSMKAVPVSSVLIGMDCTNVTTGSQPYNLSCQFKGVAGQSYDLLYSDDWFGWTTIDTAVATGSPQSLSGPFAFHPASTYRQLWLRSSCTAPSQVSYFDTMMLTAASPCITWPTASLGITPGAPVSIVCVVNKTTAWDDGLFHMMFMSVSDPPQNGFEVMAAGPYGVICVLNFCDGDSQSKGIAIDSVNWAPNVDHIIVATIDAANNQRIFVDGVEGEISSGSCGRELGLGENGYIGIHNEGRLHPLGGYELCAIYERLLGDAEIAAISATTDWHTLWTPPSPQPSPQPLPSISLKAKPAPPTVELWNSDMTYRYPNIDKEIQALKFSSILYGGFATCTFELFRKPWVHYPDLALGNKVIVRSRHQIVWYGSIAAPATDTTDLKLSIEADGPIEGLKSRLSLVTLGAASRGSAWILANLISDLNFDAGNIYTSDYAYESGIDFTAGVAYSEAVTDINKGNNYRYGFFPPAQSNHTSAEGFDFWPISSTPEYYLDMKDCDTKIQYTKDGIENVLYVKWSDGTDHYFWWPHDGGGVALPDAASVALYDRRDGKLDISGTVTLAEAEHIAQVALDWRKRIRPAADITARKITDINGATVPNAEVQAGRVLHIRGLNPGEFTLLTAQSLNELCTWPIIMSAPDIDACTVTLSPGGLGNTLEKLLARVEMVKRT